jgi:hypothetical protein
MFIKESLSKINMNAIYQKEGKTLREATCQTTGVLKNIFTRNLPSKA